MCRNKWVIIKRMHKRRQILIILLRLFKEYLEAMFQQCNLITWIRNTLLINF